MDKVLKYTDDILLDLYQNRIYLSKKAQIYQWDQIKLFSSHDFGHIQI
jgi:hypothetical protein